MVAVPTFNAKLVSTRMLAPGVRELAFERVDGTPITFLAGQWVNLELGAEDGALRRAYSLASPPSETPRFEIAVTKVDGGPGSSRLHSMEPGEVVKVVGPQGLFYRKQRTPSLFVATGTGYTPLRSMILDALAHDDASPMRLIFGVRRPEDRLYADELAALASRYPNFRAEYTLSLPDPGWTGKTGYVQTHVRALHDGLASLEAGQINVYICGLHRMVGSVRDLLRKEMGLLRQQVHSERYD